jgi:hypothetical protein
VSPSTWRYGIRIGACLGLPIIIRVASAFVLEALCALAGPPPYAEPDVEGKTDDPEGIPDAQRLATRLPLVLSRYSGALVVRRDGQERDDRDDLLLSEMRQYVAS